MPPRPHILVTCAALGAAILTVPALATELSTGRTDSVPSPRMGGMVHIPGGIFVMGLADDQVPEAELACVQEIGMDQGDQYFTQCEGLMDLRAEETGTQHEVYVSPFLIDRFEITAAEYHVCVKAGACDLSPLVAGDTRGIRDDLPVANVTWYDARAYCAFAKKRLPTEAEWEKAARGDDRRRFPWGNVDGDERANRGQMEDRAEQPIFNLSGRSPIERLPSKLSESDGSAGPAPPGSYRFGRSPYGVEDMAGNVAEWVSDWFADNGYSGLSQIDPTGVGAGTQKVVRGGSFADPRFYARTYHRRHQAPDVGSVNVGIRCARDIR